MSKRHWLVICVFLILVAVVLIFLREVDAALLLILVAVLLALIRFVMMEKGAAGSSITLGIIGILLGWLPIVGVVTAIFCSLPAIILGIISLRRKQRVGLSWTGTILGVLGLTYFSYIIIASLIEVRAFWGLGIVGILLLGGVFVTVRSLIRTENMRRSKKDIS